MAEPITPADDLKMRYETILAWIQSCTKQIQLEVCKEALNRCISDHFAPLVQNESIALLDVAQVYSDLEEAIFSQSLVIVKNDERSNYLMNGIDDKPEQ